MDISLRRAEAGDLAFARGIYFETMRWIIERLFGWDEAREVAKFAAQFIPSEVCIIRIDGEDIGWLQIEERPDSIFLKQLYVAPSHQRRGIGGAVLDGLLATAQAKGKPVELGVVKINPARALYDRHGFRVTHEDEYKVYMRRDFRQRSAK